MELSAHNLIDKNGLRLWAKSQVLPASSYDLTSLRKFISEFILTKSAPSNSSQASSASGPETWGAFMPIKNEPSLSWAQIRNMGLDLCFPKVVNDELKFFRSTEFTAGTFNLQEPSSLDEVSSDKIKGLFIPGLVFDNRGQRLGRGKAFYDRYLKDFSGLKVGLTRSQFFILGPIPVNDWDVAMDFVVTENFIFQPLISKR
jgi:5-formyltetrahydrofolate cyclo-ligase